MRPIKHLCISLSIILTLLFSILFFLTRNIEKVVVPKHINLREDLYIIVYEESKDSIKTIYYKKRK